MVSESHYAVSKGIFARQSFDFYVSIKCERDYDIAFTPKVP